MLTRCSHLALGLCFAACSSHPVDPARVASGVVAGAAPAAFLAAELRPRFYAGKALAEQPWVKAPSITEARDGLGPLYNASSCLACHPHGGRGRPAGAHGEAFVATIVRLADASLAPDPTYGGQFQPRSISVADQLRVAPKVDLSAAPLEVAAEGRVKVEWVPSVFTFPDGSTVELRRPTVSFEALGYGPMAASTIPVLRHARPVWGLGLIERISEASLRALADPDDADGDGISGRLPLVKVDGVERPGRFGWKSAQPSLRAQVAAALWGDMGLTSPEYRQPPCAPAQSLCLALPNGNDESGVEVPEPLLQSLVDFSEGLGVPPSRGEHARGKARFAELGCEGCHTATQVTFDSKVPAWSGLEFHPYSDVLVHDLGPELADPRGEGGATGAEWRTAPLWGLGRTQSLQHDAGLLHDGRARTVEEAILWHGGEAAKSREAYARMSATERAQLLAFLSSL